LVSALSTVTQAMFVARGGDIIRVIYQSAITVAAVVAL
jgi:hypothetical protein